jgi:hypothetical protein
VYPLQFQFILEHFSSLPPLSNANFYSARFKVLKCTCKFNRVSKGSFGIINGFVHIFMVKVYCKDFIVYQGSVCVCVQFCFTSIWTQSGPIQKVYITCIACEKESVF